MCRIESSPFAEVRLKQRNLIESHGEASQDEKQNMALELLRRIVEARKWGASRTTPSGQGTWCPKVQTAMISSMQVDPALSTAGLTPTLLWLRSPAFCCVPADAIVP